MTGINMADTVTLMCSYQGHLEARTIMYVSTVEGAVNRGAIMVMNKIT
jgi:hypothetical protein